jgi:hypothetical protein
MVAYKNEWVSEDVYRALQRVGTKPAERLSWLLDLAQKRDVADCNPAELVGLAEEIVVFAMRGGRLLGKRPTPDAAKLDREFLAPVRGGLDYLRQERQWTLHRPDLYFSTSKAGRSVSGPAPAVFIYQAWQLVDELREALHQCERCGLFFVAVRPFQKYCSSACGQAVHNRTYEQNKPAEHRSKLRRRSYLKTKARRTAEQTADKE